jgi:hypothetical protein
MPIVGAARLALAAARSDPPARGAALDQVVVATALALALAAVLAWVAVATHAGRLRGVRRLGALSERVSGLPAWAALPIAIGAVSLIVAAFGFYWDVSWHIDRGRDPGPFANPAHWFIIVGLAGLAVAGLTSIALTTDPPRTAIRLRRGWDVPIGGALVLVCGAIALAGFPLDDVWHALFGQDVTLWGPTHIQMIGGASLATLAMWILLEEGRRSRPAATRSPRLLPWITKRYDVLMGGSFLLGLSTLQAEFDFGVPQFRQLYQPVMVMLAAGMGLVAVRIRAGRGGALGATAFFLAMRATLALLVGPVLGRSTLHFPLYLVEALLVEAVAFAVPTKRHLRFGLWSGLLIGTVGLGAEWGWTHLWMPLPWQAALWPLGAVFGLLAALSGGVLGSLIGRALVERGPGRRRTSARLAVAAGLVAAFCLAFPVPLSAHRDYRADVSLQTVRPGLDRWTTATVRLSPPNAADDAEWFNVTAWQGAQGTRGGLVLDPVVRTGPGVYRTESAFPVFGEWKALLRLHVGSSMQAVPIYLPPDRAIPAPAVSASDRFERSFVPDKRILQREAIGGTSALSGLAYGLLGTIGLLWIASLAWGLGRIGRSTADVSVAGRRTPAA